MTRDIIAEAERLAENIAAWAVMRMRTSRISMTRTKQHQADIVTDIDLSIEMWVRDAVERAFPEHGFIGEEFGSREGSEYTWYCDPIDGTTNFAHGIGWSSFSLALVDEDGPVVAVLADPRSDEVFRAVRGQGAHLHDRTLGVERRSSLAGTVLMTELLGADPWPGMGEMMTLMGRERVTTRVMGSSALSVASVAAGRGHSAIIGEFGAVDLLAAVLIAHEAGLDVLDEEGRPTLFPASGGLLVANPGFSARLHGIWRDCTHRA